MTQLGNHEIYRGRSLAGDKIFRLRQRCLECSQLVDECAQANIAAEFINAFHVEAQTPGLGKLVDGTAHGCILKAEWRKRLPCPGPRDETVPNGG